MITVAAFVIGIVIGILIAPHVEDVLGRINKE